MAQTVATPVVPVARRRNWSSIIVGLLLLLVFSPLIFSIATKIVHNPLLLLGQLKVGLVNGAIIAIIALGYTLVYGIIELINFAHGDVYMLGAFTTLILLSLLNIGTKTPWIIRGPVLLLILAIVMAVCGGINVGIERFAYRRLRNAPRLAPLIAAIGVSFVLQNVGLVLGGVPVFEGDYWALVALVAPVIVIALAMVLARRFAAGGERKMPVWGWLILIIVAASLAIAGFNLVHHGLQSAVPLTLGDNVMGETAPGPKNVPEVIASVSARPLLETPFRLTWKDLMVLVMCGILMSSLYLFVQRTKVGKAMRATAQDRDAARLMGINVDATIALAFLLGGALGGAAGMIVGMYSNSAVFVMGFTAGLRAFTSAVLGGIGNIAGSMLGGLLIGLISALSDQYIETRWTNAVVFGILVIILVFRPSGLLGEDVGQKA
ncbi:MAG: branched-chain amino acid ABC transporter permease [Herpetosiphonaceae bacterium]|nr:branched-chain amino acid ABC transporter permease [Herpetosiphonaceae bacterium]